MGGRFVIWRFPWKYGVVSNQWNHTLSLGSKKLHLKQFWAKSTGEELFKYFLSKINKNPSRYHFYERMIIGMINDHDDQWWWLLW